MGNKKKHVAIYGAFDRMNYGDLLFPLLLNCFIKNTSSDNLDVAFYGIRKSNMTAYGGVKTLPITKFIKKAKSNDVLIVAGGEVITPTWDRINYYLLPNRKNLKYFFYKVRRKIFKSYFKKPLTKFPFVISNDDCKHPIDVYYNSVGGCGFNKLEKQISVEIQKGLRDAKFISVRDHLTKKHLESCNIENIYLQSDIAVLLSKFYPIKLLKEKFVNDKYLNLLNDKYIVFQIGQFYYSSIKEKEILYSQLKKIVDDYGYKLVLLPIGTAKGHEDDKPLSIIKNKIPESILIEEPGIYDIMFIIAHSKYTIATSLHANITAFSYGVKNIPFTDYDKKLPAFIETWISVYRKSYYNVDEIYNAISDVDLISNEDWNKLVNQTIDKCYMEKSNMIDQI